MIHGDIISSWHSNNRPHNIADETQDVNKVRKENKIYYSI
jgi:hypothetical protein